MDFENDQNVIQNVPVTQGHSRKRVTSADAGTEAMPSAHSRGRSSKGSGRKSNVLLRRIIIFSVLEVITVIGILVFAFASKQYGKIQRPKVDENVIKNMNLSSEAIERIEKGYWNIAVFGVDTRDSSVGKGANSDVIIIASINRETGAIQLISVFRDTYLKVNDNTYSKINSAYCHGGPEQALKALNENLDLNITQYVTFNWKAVATGINILGGVDIDISKAEYNWINGYITETVKSTGIGSTQLTGPGYQHLDGVQAVAYARLRYMDNDYARTERQRKVIGECFNKAKQTDVKTLTSMIGVMLELVATNMTWQDGLDAVGNIMKYNIADTAGFPFARGEANLGKAGACVIPQTLESNVRDLHTMLFPEEEYQPSEHLLQISANISAKSGMYNEGTNIGHVSTEGWMPSTTGGSKSGSGEVSETESSQEGTTEEIKKKKNDNKEYAISKDGYLIYVDSVDSEGNKKYKYMLDDNGNRIKMVEQDEYGNIVYLYEIDEDGNFYFNGEEQPTTAANIKETDEDGNILPGQDDDEENYGPGYETTTAASAKPGQEKIGPVDRDEIEGPGAQKYGPGSESQSESEGRVSNENITPGGDDDDQVSPGDISHSTTETTTQEINTEVIGPMSEAVVVENAPN